MVMRRLKIGDGPSRNTDTPHQSCQKTGKYPTLAISYWSICFHKLSYNFDLIGFKINHVAHVTWVR